MTTEQAQSAVSLSAFVVAAVFGYRKLVEQSAQGAIAGVPATGHFVIGFGFTYVILALLAQGAPQLGGMMAILVAAGDLLANGKPLVNDVGNALKATQAATSTTQAAGAPMNVTTAGIRSATLVAKAQTARQAVG